MGSAEESIDAPVLDDPRIPIIRYRKRSEDEDEWSLLILDDSGEQVTETLRLEGLADAEEAVGEAKWILEKRAWDTHWAAVRHSRQSR